MRPEEEIKRQIKLCKEAMNWAIKAKAFCSAICQEVEMKTLEWVLKH